MPLKYSSREMFDHRGCAWCAKRCSYHKSANSDSRNALTPTSIENRGWPKNAELYGCNSWKR